MRIAGPSGPLKSAAILTLVAIVLAACGGGSAAATPVPLAPAATAAPTPAVAAGAPVATASPTAVPRATPASTVTPTAGPTATPTPAPTATPITTPEPSPTPELLKTFNQFGFTLNLDRGADVKTAGFPSGEPNAQQGVLSFATGGVIVVLIWLPPAGNPPLTLLRDTYDLLQRQQPDLSFETIRDGDITVSQQQGVFGGFRTSNSTGATVGGGIIGAWICSGPGTGYTLTVAGADATIVQIRFDRLIDNFTCGS